MRVLLVANYEPDGQESMLRHAAWLASALTARGHQITVIRPQPFFSKLLKHLGVSKYLGYIDKFILFPRTLRRIARAHDLIHILDHSNSMYLSAARDCPKLITCHDVLAIRAARDEFPEVKTGWSGKLLQRWILSGMRTARNVVCVSTKTAEDLKKLSANDSANIRIIGNALNWDYQPDAMMTEAVAARVGISSDQIYFLHVGGNQWYKNRVGVLRIFSEMIKRERFSNAALVMVGKPWTQPMRALIQEKNLGGRVVEAVSVSSSDLQVLYANAHALLFPSLEEGFGQPIVEAQACGCPVITTGRPPMCDVAGDAAIFIDPAKPEDAVVAIERGLQQRDRLREAGFRNLARFEESRILNDYCSFYESIVASRAFGRR
jgi:glycosyltransferase involved in cell wall biosynthesis